MSDHLHPKSGCTCPDCNLARVAIDTWAGATVGKQSFPLSVVLERTGREKDLQFTDAEVQRFRKMLEDDEPPGPLARVGCGKCGGPTDDIRGGACLSCRGKMAMERSEELIKRMKK